MRRIFLTALLAILLALTAACTNKKINNPLANVGSKQPDKVLFDRSMDALKHNRFDVARMTLQTLINTYPDSEYIARAKLAVADSWYAEGGTAALSQAEAEYKDFKTFFPNMPEAAEAQYKVANIHYQQMEKPDRDYTHGLRAEQEYRAMIQEYPDSKLVPVAKARLREVQEVLAQREFNIGRFYYLRSAYPAAIARLRTLVDRYPLYSGADEALYLLGQSYEGEIDLLRKNANIKVEATKARMIQEFTKNAADAYGRIITRYPAEDRAVDAKSRLQALHQPVPRPTRAAMELSKKEVASRQEPGMFTGVMRNFQKHPDVERATKVGDPTLVDPTPTNAIDVIQAATKAASGSSEAGENKVTVETVNGAPAPNQAAPRSDAAPATDQPAGAETQPGGAETQPSGGTDSRPGSKPETVPANGTSDTSNSTAGELKPNVPDPNELKPNVPADPNALPPPQQTNEISTATSSSSSSASSSKSGGNPEDLVDISSSKKKKKKGIGKLNPF